MDDKMSAPISFDDEFAFYRITNEDAATIREALKLLKKRVEKIDNFFLFEERLEEIRHIRKVFKKGAEKYNDSCI